MKKFGILLLLILMTLLLVACRPSDDRDILHAYVQGALDAIYKGEFSPEYMNVVGNPNTFELQESFLEGMDYEAEFFAYYFQMEELPNDIRSRVIRFYTDVYAKAKYKVGAVSPSEDNYTAELTIHPIDIIYEYIHDGAFTAYVDTFNEEYGDSQIDSLEFERIWASGILDELEARIDSLGYQDPVKLVLLLEKDEEGMYFISDDDMSRIDELIITY